MLLNKVRPVCYDNDLDAAIPQQWTVATLAILVENMKAAATVNRDFEDDFAKLGDTVNTRRPRKFTAKRKMRGDDVTTQDAISDPIPVVLNQRVHVSFIIDDGDETLAITDMIKEYLYPAAIALASFADRVVLGQVYQFLANQSGSLEGLTSSNAIQYLTETERVMNNNLVPDDDGLRYLAVGANTKSQLMQNQAFSNYQASGTTAGLIESSLGRKFGFNLWMGQNVPSLLDDSSLGSGAINNGNLTVGSTTLTVDGFGASEIVAGQWISINGHPYHVTATDNSTATSLTLEYGLKAAVANDDAIKVYDKFAVSHGGGYAAGWSKAITIGSVSGGSLQKGQLVTFGTDTDRYSVIDTDGTTYMVLDRPLEAAVTDAENVNMGPCGGDYNFAYHRNALTLAVRPLAPPRPGTGAVSGYSVHNGIGLRTVITYDGEAQAHRVTMDFLAGVKVLDQSLGAVMLG